MDTSPASSTSSTSSSSSSSSVHHASLVDPSLHSPALLELLDIKLTAPVIEYVVDCVAETVDFAMGRPSSSRGTSRRANTAFTTFVTNVIMRAELTTPVILASLVYIDRAKPHLHIALEEWAHERVFLGAVICASKYLNDSTLKNIHWALCTGVFGKRDIGRIEREFLDVLDFQLGITEDDVLSHHDNLSAVAVSTHVHRLHATRRQHHHAPHTLTVPPLDPSSPASSLSGSSPGTPNTIDSSPLVASSPISPKHEAIVHPKPQRPKRSSLHFSTFDLLRSFPVPRHQNQKNHGASQNDRHYRPMPIMPVGA
jgi:hypothetical protein